MYYRKHWTNELSGYVCASEVTLGCKDICNARRKLISSIPYIRILHI